MSSLWVYAQASRVLPLPFPSEPLCGGLSLVPTLGRLMGPLSACGDGAGHHACMVEMVMAVVVWVEWWPAFVVVIVVLG